MDSHHKNPMENHHYIYAHGRDHIDYKIHNIEVAQTPECFLGLEDFLDYNDLLSAIYIKVVSMRLLKKIIYKRPSLLILSQWEGILFPMEMNLCFYTYLTLNIG